MKKEILVKEKSSPSSVFAVFENFKDWKGMRQNKIIPDGFYFAVLQICEKGKADIHPDLFVQGYRPHSSGAQIHVDKRRYGKFIPDEKMRSAQDDLLYSQAQLYQVIRGNEVELVLLNGESQTLEGANKLTQRVCQQYGLEQLSDAKRYCYHCPSSAGYFLACRSYDVWSVLVGKNEGLSLKKKVLIFDYWTGIPAIVPYDDRHFEAVSE